jgi:hypothetical protein
VHAEEFVTRSEVVRQPGALAFLARFNRVGMQALRGYASGGLVSDMIIPSISSASGSSSSAAVSRDNLTLDFGSLGKFQAHASADTKRELERVFVRAAMARGRK